MLFYVVDGYDVVFNDIRDLLDSLGYTDDAEGLSAAEAYVTPGGVVLVLFIMSVVSAVLFDSVRTF